MQDIYKWTPIDFQLPLQSDVRSRLPVFRETYRRPGRMGQRGFYSPPQPFLCVLCLFKINCSLQSIRFLVFSKVLTIKISLLTSTSYGQYFSNSKHYSSSTFPLSTFLSGSSTVVPSLRVCRLYIFGLVTVDCSRRPPTYTVGLRFVLASQIFQRV